MSSLKEQIQKLAKSNLSELIKIRRHLHQHPELSFQEFKTSKYLKSTLESWGIPIDQEWVETGFSVLIDSGNPGPRIALRADIDALPIQELNEVDYCSKNDGIMHACGHDVHATCLMGVAKIASQLKGWNGSLVLFFQAGEEKLPGGASLMIKEGILDKYQPDAIYAQHVYPDLPAGEVGFKEGMYMASADEIYINIKGKGGHAAMPHNTKDPILASATLIQELQSVASRFVPTTVPFVLSIGKIIGNGATNVIPSEVSLEGTMRAMDEEWRFKAHDKIRAIANGLAKSLAIEIDVDIKVGYPFLVNDPSKTATARQQAESYLGDKSVSELPLRMTAEDFAYFSQKVPACFYRLGVNTRGSEQFGVHHPKFNVNEDCIETGVGLMTFIALNQ